MSGSREKVEHEHEWIDGRAKTRADIKMFKTLAKTRKSILIFYYYRQRHTFIHNT